MSKTTANKTTKTTAKVKTAASKKNMLPKAPVAHGVGRRKSSVARVWLRHGEGKITINTKDLGTYFHTDVSKRSVLEPLAMSGAGALFDIDINVSGGGVHSQAGASRLGIARALVAYDKSYTAALREGGFLTVDARVKERKKYGQRGARRKFQFVKR